MFGLQALAVTAAVATAGTPYAFSHQTAHTQLTGGLRLKGHRVSQIGITTDDLRCKRPGQQPFFPGPPFNWQPQQTFAVKRAHAGLKLSFNASFRDRISGFPETMSMRALITKKRISGKVSLYADDNVASTGEEICQTRGFVPFAGKVLH